MSNLSEVDNAKLLARVVRREEQVPALSGFSVGYECSVWRIDDFADRVFDELPSFALKHSEWSEMGSESAVRLLRRAAKKIYDTDKYKNRGEFGELILHTLLRMHFETLPAVSKIYYKDSPNDTVKGFDAVHVVVASDGLELWLGEAKLYPEVKRAVRDVVKELHLHSQRKYLKTELPLIVDKIDPTWPHADRLKLMLDPNNPIDAVFRRTRFPVLL